MSGSITDTLGWLAGSFYVIVALSIVYLYFFRIAPMVISTIKEWNIFVVIRVTIVLASLAFLIGCVAVITGDWIFSQVLDTLPRTRMAREIDRVSGSLVRLSAPGPIYNAEAPYNPGAGVSAAPGAQASAGATGPQPATEEVISFPLKPNAIDLWITTVQQRFNSTGRITDNEEVMARRDIPQGVTCDVAAVDGLVNGWRLKSSEEWQLLCSMDGFRNVRTLRVNGTAARGLTGGGFYSTENPYTVYGEGLWPEQAYDLTKPTQAAPAPTVSSTPNDGAVGAAATPNATTANTHEVQRGESLALIAQRYQINVDSLVQANVGKYPQLTRNPNVIVVGWVLTIPNQ
jgi:hypothetical protein